MTTSSTLAAGDVIEVDDETFDLHCGFRSHSIPSKEGRQVAVRVVSQFGEESTKVLTLG